MNLTELPKGWVWTTLDQTSQINPRISNELPDDTEVSFLPMRCVEEMSGKADLSLTRPYKEVRKGFTSFQDGDVLFAKITPCMENGKVAVVHSLKNSIGFGSTEFHVIRPFNQMPASLLFFFLIQESLRRDAQRNMTGTAGQLRVPSRYFSGLPFPLPPLPEQRRIVAKVEELFTRLDAGVEALKKIQLQLKRYRQSVLKEAFSGELTAEWRKAHQGELEPASVLLEKIKEERKKSGKYKELPLLDISDLPELPDGWEWTKIGDVENFIGSGITPKGGKNVYVTSGIIFLRSQNVYPGGLRLDDVAYITREINLRMERSMAHSGDVLLNITGASIGRSTIIPESFEPANVNQHVCIIRMRQGIVPGYLSFFLNSPFGQSQIFLTQGGVTRQGLNYTQVRSISFPLPPVTEQRKIVQEIERQLSIADKMENTIEQSLKLAERLRQSILKKAFEGKLVPQNPDDETAEKLLERIRTEKSRNGNSKRMAKVV